MGLVSAGAAVVVLASVPSGAGVGGRPGPADPADGTAPVVAAPDAASAAAAARAQGSRVEAVDLRTETRVVYAEPDGTMTAELTTRPVRVERGGSWVDVDPTLVRRRDGSVGPTAATVDLSFSGGGADGPLVRYGDGDAMIELSWPGELPVPVLAADTATYREVLPGVDLLLRAEVDGFGQYLVVKERPAAMAEVRLGLRTEGLTLRSTPAGELEARDAGGTVIFAAPVSRMWDSATPPREAEVGVAVEGDVLVLRPDQDLLTDPATRYPVTVDPIWHTADRHAWATVLSGKPTESYWNRSADPYNPSLAQLGRCYEDGTCDGIGAARTYWMFDTSFLAGKLVLEAYLDFDIVYSPDCNSPRTHQVYFAHAAISPSTSWSNMPGGTHVADLAAGTAGRAGCPGKRDVAASVPGAVNRGGTTTFFVRAADENDQLAWRKYDNIAQLRVRFNTVPNVPTELSTDPPLRAPCTWCDGVSYFGDENIRLRARLTDPDPGDWTEGHWLVKIDGTALPEAVGPGKPSGNLHDHVVDLTDQHGKAVEWAVKASDGVHGGGWAHGTSFVLDQEPPTVRPNVTGVLYQPDNRWHGGVGVPGTFAFDSAGVADIDHFVYGWTDSPTTKVDADRLGGKATVVLAPPSDGPQDLYVESVDRAGHHSPTRVYHFYVRAGNGPLAQWEFEGSAVDEAFLGDRDGTLHGDAAYVPGAVGQAVRLDGAGDHVTAPNALRTDASFSVSVWVRLDQPPPVPHTYTVLSQDGAAMSGFFLSYRQLETEGRWEFLMPSADSTTDPGGAAVRSSQPAQLGEWTHLTAIYDAPAGQLRLHVNGAPAATATIGKAFHATGPVAIGRARYGEPTSYWAGLVDEVKLYDRILTETEIRAAVGADDVQASHWRFDEVTGTTARNQVEGAEMAILHDGASFTGDSDGDELADGGAVGGAVRLDGQAGQVTTTGPAVHTDRSFSVAAWVRLDRPPPVPHTYTALSQDGTDISGFLLGYRQLDSGGVWSFYTPSADTTNAPGGAVVRSSQPAQVGEWTHLTAVYDSAAGQLRLYVNGEEAGTASFDGGFDATGPFVVGRGHNGGPSGYWPGLVDEVRAYSRELSEAEVRAIVSRDGVALGEWHLDGNADDASGNGRHGTPHGNPDWTTGQTEVPDPTDLAARMDGNDHISLPHTIDVRSSFSVAAWAKVDRTGGTATLLSQDGQQSSAFQLMVSPDGQWVWRMSGDDRVDGPVAQVGVWTHLVGIYDAGAAQLSLYVNGVPAGTAALTQAVAPADGELQIGAGLSAGNRLNRFVGAVDDVAVYGRMLFAGEIRTMAGRDLTLAHNWRLDESGGDRAADAVGARSATAAGGVTRVPGRLGNAVELNGENGRLTTSGVDIRTDASFTVTAWVRLTETCDPGTQFSCTLAAVSLDGGGDFETSKFRLGHLADQNLHRDGVWVFEMSEPDGAARAAVTILPSDLDEWVHLAGVYDQPTGTLWLYVNGTRKGDARLDEPWHATGGLQIGRGLDAAGTPGQYFPGGVDDVRLYSGGLDDGRISNLYGSYPVDAGTPELPVADTGHWAFDEATGTTAADSSGHGRDLTLTGGASWSGAGRIGGMAGYDGTSGSAQTTDPVVDTSRGFSIAAWVVVSATAGSGERVVLGQDGTFQLRYHGGAGRWEAVAPGATAVRVASTEPAYPGVWTHLGLVYNPGAGLDQLLLYVNGRLSGARAGVEIGPAGGPLAVGRGSGTGSFFKGYIDDVRAYGEVLSRGEMARVHDDAPPIEYGRWQFDDQTLRDSSSRNTPTTGTGALAYVDGADGGRALSLDGESYATSGAVGVRTTDSFTVSAWARLTYEPATQTVVAQDGGVQSGFALQYRPGLDRWAFAVPVADEDGSEWVYAASGPPAVLDQWVHLTGVYDHAAGQLRLYVDGELAGERDGVTLWNAGGGLTIGRGLVNGVPAQMFHGAVDDVRIDIGIVPDEQIANRAGSA